jgi:hypothetical protein
MVLKTTFEKYLDREPLTEDLARLRDGLGEPLPALTGILQGWKPGSRIEIEDEDRSLTRAERLTLLEGRQGGTVTTVIRLLRRSLRAKIRAATINSENDPLGRQAEIAQEWAYVMTFRRSSMELESLILAEIAILEAEEAGDK